MPAPYSDDIYSDMGQDGASVSGDDRDALSPTDGYFHASETSETASSQQYAAGHGRSQQYNPYQYQHQHSSSHVPAVPNVLVEDPTLQESSAAAAKAKEAEAERERSINNGVSHASRGVTYFTPQTGTAASGSTSSAVNDGNTTSIPPASPTFVTSPTHHHRRSVEEDGPLLFTGHSTRLPYSHRPSDTTAPPVGSNSLNHMPSRPRTHHQSHLDAPPAYSPSPSSPPSGSSSQGYQTFSPPTSGSTHNSSSNNNNNNSINSDNMGVPEEHQALLPRHPQSMGGSPSGNGPPISRWQRVKNAANSPRARSNIKTLLGIAVILSILFAIFGGISLSNQSSRRPQTPKITDPDPVKEPVMGGERDLEWRPTSQCRNSPYKQGKAVSDITFDSGYTLHIEQKPERNNHRGGRTPNISGALFIRPSKDDSKKGTVEIEIISNDEKLSADRTIDIDDDGRQSVKIITPHVLDWWDYNSQAPCIQMRVTVYVPKSGYLDSLSLDVVHLDVEIAEGLVMGAIDGPIIKTVVGNVKTPRAGSIEDDVVPYAMQSRQIVIQTVSGNICGWFPLYDLLKIESASGDVDVQVAPKPADKESAKAAMLSVHSISGSVKIEEPLKSVASNGKLNKKLPPRDYVVKVETASGDIQADVAMTSDAGIESVSGDLTLVLMPLLPKGSSKTSLRTDTKSGTTNINVYDPVEFDLGADEKAELRDTEVRKVSDGAALSDFQTSHQSISGNIKLFYPGSWTGKFKAETISGDVSAKGKDVKIIRSGRGITKSMEGEKGDGNSFIKMGSMSGDLRLQVGKN
ncbi:hypothetical protein QQS21_008333 [Conoideocrella luteorostrata]|uniref:DUF4097 domain-containing protein n=1 Tax=Conoideocrella luteorostrata TaxID=1105319 RepID=A0AAJ0CLS9_9HYPO|nr:hypothetical protein QQS21_008333 [Conoideocrella luteorostrata]